MTDWCHTVIVWQAEADERVVECGLFSECLLERGETQKVQQRNNRVSG